MKKIIGFCDFCDEFRGSQYENNFSYEGKIALFDYLKDLEDQAGVDYDLDIVALCCDYTEYENFTEFKENYPNVENEEEIQDNTQYIPIYNNDGTESERFIIQNY